MSTIKIEDVAYVRFRAPRLEQTRDFLLDFGLIDAGHRAGSLFMAGLGSSPFLHWTEEGDPGFAALGLRAASMADLETLAAAIGGTISPLDAPGGGLLLRALDPDGIAVEVVAGQHSAGPRPGRDAAPWNSAASRRRVRSAKRLTTGPAHVERLGHVVLRVQDFRRSEAWYKTHFGFITSDEIEGSDDVAIGAFLRCDLGETPTDHHTLALIQHAEAPSLGHAAFEVADLDDLILGYEHLTALGHEVDWGIGRHILGSQVFAYWRDPWGHRLEHWTDGDLLTRSDGSRKASVDQLRAVQWGLFKRPST